MEKLPPKQIDPLIITFIGMFQDERYGYKVLVSSVIVNTFYALYNQLIQVDVAPIEAISVENKTLFWEIAKRYYTTQEQAVIASKVAYILTLISKSE